MVRDSGVEYDNHFMFVWYPTVEPMCEFETSMNIPCYITVTCKAKA